MLSKAMRALILEEQARQNGCFIPNVDLDAYLAKLEAKAEFVSDTMAARCRGFVAFYCNDMDTRKAYITLVLVDPLDRGLGIGQALVAYVLSTAKRRGFIGCQLEVSKGNQAAYEMYLSQGFHLLEDRGGRCLLEIDL